MKKIRLDCISFVVILSIIPGIAQVSGVVYNQGNQPVSNALIYIEQNPAVFAKTNNSGNFTINASINDYFRIAALSYETKKNYRFSANNNNNVILQRDQFLELGDDYHISFDHCKPGPSYNEVELKQDFPVANGIGFEDGTQGSDRAMIDDSESIDAFGHSLRIKFPKGGLKTSASGVDTRIPLAKTFKDNDYSGEDVYLSYWIKFSNNFEFDKCGGKLPSLGGSDLGLRTNGWKGRIMWRNQGSIQFYMELPHDNDGFEDDMERFWGQKVFDGGSICTNQFSSYLKAPGWHNIELHYKLDRGIIGVGTFEGWVDGGKGYKKIDSEVFGYYRPIGGGYDNLTTNAILISAFLGGSSTDYEPLQDTYAWVDEFRVSKKRINEYSKYSVLSSDEKISNNSENYSALVEEPQSMANNTGIFLFNEIKEWIIFDSFGVKVSNNHGDRIDLSQCSKGLYLVQIENKLIKLLYY